MKFFLALAVLATSAAAVASSRDIYDLMYLPNAGTTYGFTEAAAITGSYKGSGFDGDISGTGVNQTIGHAFTDRFSLQAEIDYMSVKNKTDIKGFGNQQSSQQGVGDPKLTARFRAMDEAFRLDLIGAFKISREHAKEELQSDGGTDSNNTTGSNAFELGAQFGQKQESFQWSILGLLTHNFDGTTESTGKDVDTKSNNELLLRADVITKLAEKSFVRPFASVDFQEKVKIDGGGEQSAPNTVYNFGAEYQYLCSKDLLARAGVDYSSSNQAGFDDFTFWTFKLAANYQF